MASYRFNLHVFGYSWAWIYVCWPLMKTAVLAYLFLVFSLNLLQPLYCDEIKFFKTLFIVISLFRSLFSSFFCSIKDGPTQPLPFQASCDLDPLYLFNLLSLFLSVLILLSVIVSRFYLCAVHSTSLPIWIPERLKVGLITNLFMKYFKSNFNS